MGRVTARMGSQKSETPTEDGAVSIVSLFLRKLQLSSLESKSIGFWEGYLRDGFFLGKRDAGCGETVWLVSEVRLRLSSPIVGKSHAALEAGLSTIKAIIDHIEYFFIHH